jgi:hypothetical protein
MSTPTLAPPRRAAGRAAAPPPPAPPVRRRARHPGTRERARGVWHWAFVASILLHVLVLLLSPVFIRIGDPPGDPDAARSTTAGGLRMVDPELIPADPATPAPVPSEALADELTATAPETRAPAPLTPARPGPVGPDPEAPGARDHPLRPGIRDSRLWITPREVPEHEPSHEELHAEYMKGLEARIRAWNDSIAGDAERARRATDWTVRDRDGRRWGVSPDGIHLGDITLPPMTFPPGGGDPDRRRQWEEQERMRREIDRQEADAERRRAREESTNRTRERRDAERP